MMHRALGMESREDTGTSSKEIYEVIEAGCKEATQESC
jgi:hypothetical protein